MTASGTPGVSGGAALFALVLAAAATFGACGESGTRPARDAGSDTGGPGDDGGVTTVASSATLLDELPPDFPALAIPADEPITVERADLARRLFYDVRLSGNQTQSCASCHLQEFGFTDGLETSIGSTFELHFRNAPTLANVGFRSVLTWANPTQRSLSEQALLPLFGERPVELGNLGHETELLARIRAVPRYQVEFAAAFPGEVEPITVHTIVVALATFQRTILSYRSDYDRYVYGGDDDALSASAKRGLAMFFDERFECHHCHSGHDLSDSTMTSLTVTPEITFHNTGLYNVDGFGSYPAHDRGVMDITTMGVDMGRFRVPTLRNLGLTAPYFHDGSARTLDDVLDHYAHGGRLLTSGPYAGDGSTSPFRSEFVKGFAATAEERADLIAFLLSLTDYELARDPRLANPWTRP